MAPTDELDERCDLEDQDRNRRCRRVRRKPGAASVAHPPITHQGRSNQPFRPRTWQPPSTPSRATVLSMFPLPMSPRVMTSAASRRRASPPKGFSGHSRLRTKCHRPGPIEMERATCASSVLLERKGRDRTQRSTADDQGIGLGQRRLGQLPRRRRHRFRAGVSPLQPSLARQSRRARDGRSTGVPRSQNPHQTMSAQPSRSASVGGSAPLT